MRFNLKKCFKMANKAYLAVALSIVVTTGSISLVTFAKNTTTPIQYSVYDIIGDASQYGIICDKLTVNADLESNFAANSVIFAGQADAGNHANKFTNVDGTIYIKELTQGTIQLYPTNNLVVGTPYSINDNILTFDNGSTILLANSSNVKVALDADYMNVNESIESIANSVNNYTATTTTDGALVNLKDMNNAIIDITNCSSNICTAYISLSEYKSVQPGGLKIYKNNSQALIIKLVNDGNTTLVNDDVTNLVTENVYINRYFINNENSAVDNALNSETIIWNLTDFNDTIITISEGCGIFIAPDANVALGGCGRGHIVSKFFTTSGNEWHFLSDYLSEETSTIETSITESTTISTETDSNTETTTNPTETDTSSEEITTRETESNTEITTSSTENTTISTEVESSKEETTSKETESTTNPTEKPSEEITTRETENNTEITTSSTENTTNSTEVESSKETESDTETTTNPTETDTSSEEITTRETESNTEITTSSTESTTNSTEVESSKEEVTSKETESTTETTTNATESPSEEVTTKETEREPEITTAPYEEINTTQEETTKKPSGILGTEIVKETTTPSDTTSIEETTKSKKGEVLGTEIINEKETPKKSEVLSSEEINTGDKNNFLVLGVITIASFTTVIVCILESIKKRRH